MGYIHCLMKFFAKKKYAEEFLQGECIHLETSNVKMVAVTNMKVQR